MSSLAPEKDLRDALAGGASPTTEAAPGVAPRARTASAETAAGVFVQVARACGESLAFQHHFLRPDENPVLRRVRAGEALGAGAAGAIAQYTLLPASIVALLDACRQRVAGWPAVADELARNIGEERGARTAGISHYAILCRTLRRELGIDVAGTRPRAATARFLDALFHRIAVAGPEEAGGVAYALEASAVPELAVVGLVLNEVAACAGRAPPFRPELMADPGHARELRENKHPRAYTLGDSRHAASCATSAS